MTKHISGAIERSTEELQPERIEESFRIDLPVSKEKEIYKTKKIWIDIDNSPHVPFFLPIIDELNAAGVELMLTARDMYQVVELLQFFNLDCRVIGTHTRGSKIVKVACNVLRAAQLVPIVTMGRPDLAISHGSRAQVLVAKMLGIPTLLMHDYEFSTKTGFLEPDWVLMPDVIPDGVMSKKTEHVLRYPGLKEDVYIPRFRPDPSILAQLGIPRGALVVTMRPPATEAHYHNPESEVLFAEALRVLAKHPNAKAVTLPRNHRQGDQLRQQFSEFISSGLMLIPDHPVNGLNLIWHSDLVVSGGGTMNREAAALGVPVYSIFRGKIGAVDHYLADTGRLTLLETPADVYAKLKLQHWKRPTRPEDVNALTLDWIVDNIIAILHIKNNGQKLPSKKMGPGSAKIGRGAAFGVEEKTA